MRELWAVLQNAGELTSCENLNAPYQDAVYNELCTSLPAGLLGFWVSCVILTVLLLLLVSQSSSREKGRFHNLFCLFACSII